MSVYMLKIACSYWDPSIPVLVTCIHTYMHTYITYDTTTTIFFNNILNINMIFLFLKIIYSDLLQYF